MKFQKETFGSQGDTSTSPTYPDSHTVPLQGNKYMIKQSQILDQEIKGQQCLSTSLHQLPKISILKDSISTERENFRYEDTCQRMLPEEFNYDFHLEQSINQVKNVDNFKLHRGQNTDLQQMKEGPFDLQSNHKMNKSQKFSISSQLIEGRSSNQNESQRNQLYKTQVFAKNELKPKNLGYHRKPKQNDNIENLSQISISPISPTHSNYQSRDVHTKSQIIKPPIKHFNEKKSFSDYGNPLVTPCFFQNDTPLKNKVVFNQDEFFHTNGIEDDDFNDFNNNDTHNELNSQDFKDGNDQLFAFEQKHKNSKTLQIENTSDKFLDEDLPTFEYMIQKAINYFSNSDMQFRAVERQSTQSKTNIDTIKSDFETQIQYVRAQAQNEINTLQLRSQNLEEQLFAKDSDILILDEKLNYQKNVNKGLTEKVEIQSKNIEELTLQVQQLLQKQETLGSLYLNTKSRKDKNKKLVFDVIEMIQEEKQSEFEEQQFSEILSAKSQNQHFQNFAFHNRQRSNHYHTRQNSPRNMDPFCNDFQNERGAQAFRFSKEQYQKQDVQIVMQQRNQSYNHARMSQQQKEFQNKPQFQ
eukprot:403339524